MVRGVTGKTFARKFITLGKVINYWAEAVGPELAAKSYPIGMSVRKTRKKDKNDRELVATLEIATSSADATLIHYQKKMILERLSLLLGASMIEDIKIIHNAPVATMAALSAPIATSALPPAPHLPILDHVDDPELRLALARLGQYIGGQQPPKE